MQSDAGGSVKLPVIYEHIIIAAGEDLNSLHIYIFFTNGIGMNLDENIM